MSTHASEKRVIVVFAASVIALSTLVGSWIVYRQSTSVDERVALSDAGPVDEIEQAAPVPSIGDVQAPPPLPQAQPAMVQAELLEEAQPTIEPIPIEPPQPSQLIIHFHPEATEQERSVYIEEIGGVPEQTIDALDVIVVTVPEAVTEQPLPESPVVESGEPDYHVVALDEPVSDPRYPEQWALPVIGAPDAWETIPPDAPMVLVAVIDSGICVDHPDLGGRIAEGWDFVEDDAVPQDDFGHGCSVAGVIAANVNNGMGIAGVAPNTTIVPLRVLNAEGVGTYSDVAAAIVSAADDGVSIINLSLGGYEPSDILAEAVDYAVSRGVMVIAAAGNTGSEGVLYPAAYESVIAVGSVDADLEPSGFSSTGPAIDLWAPGGGILATGLNGDYTFLSGTSMAAPHVAGVAALEMALGNELTVNGDVVSVGGEPPTGDEPPVPPPPSDVPTPPLPGGREAPLRIMVPYEMPEAGITDLSTMHPQMDPILAFSPGPQMVLPQVTPFRALAILVRFTDNPAAVGAASFDTLLFGETGNTLRTYYQEVSYNQLDIVTVNLPSSLGWRAAPQTYAYYVGGAYGDSAPYPNNCRRLAEDMVNLVDPLVDFSQYDNNGDGWVDTVFIVHAGPGAEVTRDPNDIWSHSWWTYNSPYVDGVWVGSYTTEPEYWLAPGDMTHGVYAHEFGHAIGLPDLYDVDGSSEGVGDWSLMSGGSWNGIMGDTPTHLDAWSRIYLEFTSATVVASDQAISLPNVEQNSTGAIHRINAGIPEEYFLLENRQLIGSDSALSGDGLLIWHVDERVPGSNRYECLQANNWLCSDHFRVALEQADGYLDLEYGYWGDDGDPFPGSSNNTSFAFNTNPSSSSYYTTSDATYPGLLVNSISASASTMSANVDIQSYTPIPVPPNDDFDNASIISAFPYSDSQSTLLATDAVDDPTPSCVFSIGRTVWYEYTATSNERILFYTNDSDFDTVLSIWTGARGDLTEVACNDDRDVVAGPSSVSISPIPGETYFIMAGGWEGDSGNLVFDGVVLCDTITGIPAEECEALVTLYESTDGDNWWDNTDWLLTETPCSWYGVACEFGHVTNLDLINNDLSGSVPPELANLPNLAELNLGYNDLSGEIPSWLTSLTNLSTIYLSYNHLTGTIPSGLDGLPLEVLKLSGNSLSGNIPSELGNLQATLDILSLSNNQLSGEIPVSLTNLNLNPSSLGVSYNMLTASDPDLVDYLNGFDSWWSDTQTIPPDLQVADVGTDSVTLSWTPIPYTEHGGYYEIRSATAPGGPYDVVHGSTDDKTASGYVVDNLLPGPYYFVVRTYTPAHGDQQSDLWSSYSNEVSATPTRTPACGIQTEIPLTECEALATLYDSTNGAGWFNGDGWKVTTTPCSWYGVTCGGGHVTELHLTDNNLTGSLPSELGYLIGLQQLHLSINQIGGGIPPELGSLSNLVNLNLWDNQLTGSIPPELGNLSSLQYLYLDGNQLSGSIPTELGELDNLVDIFLNENQLTGSIPSSLGSLSNLEFLILSYNGLSGSIPPELGNLSGLHVLGLDYDNLTGNIPPELGNLSSLEYFWLSGNELSGSIPAQLGNLSNLLVLSLWDNQLTGGIPVELGNLTNLVYLDLQWNRLDGVIPSALGDLFKLQALYLSNNALVGDVPTSFNGTNFPYLSSDETDLGYNMLTADPTVTAFLNTKDPDWALTQTTPPTNVQVTGTTYTTATLSWTLPTYTADGGYYQIAYAASPGGPYTVHGATGNKITTSYTVNGLEPNMAYYFVVRAYTPPHGDQQNALFSPDGQEASASTPLVHPLLEDRLGNVYGAYQASGIAVGLQVAQEQGIPVSGSNVLIIVLAQENPDALAASLQGLGATIQGQVGNEIHISLPIYRLVNAASLLGVRTIVPQQAAVPLAP